MDIFDYQTSSGKNVILEYISLLPNAEKTELLAIRQLIWDMGIDAFPLLNTRQLYKKIWEIKASQERIMYVIRDHESVFFLNICKKQKGKTEKVELNKAIKRAKEAGLL